VKHVQVKKLTYIAAAGTLTSVTLMSLSLVFPGPMLLVLAMSVGQALGILSLTLFLLATALDLNIGGALVDDAEEQVRAVRDDQSHE